MVGTSSLAAFSLRHLRKLSSSKLHSTLGSIEITDPVREGPIAYPWLKLLVIKNIMRLG